MSLSRSYSFSCCACRNSSWEHVCRHFYLQNHCDSVSSLALCHLPKEIVFSNLVKYTWLNGRPGPSTIRHYTALCLSYRAISGHRAKLSAQARHYGSLTVSCRADRYGGPSCPWLREKSRSSLCLASRRRRAPPLSYSQARERAAVTRMRLRRRLRS